MTVMTITATHLTEAHRMRRGFGKLHALFLMAAVTHLRLGEFIEHGIL